MSRFNLYLLLITTVIAILSSTSKSIRFELESGNTKCIAEDIKSNSMTVGKYSIVNPHDGQPLPDSYKLTVRVTSSYGNNYHHSELVESGQFAFTASEAGDYMACFWAADHKPAVTLNIDFDWKTGVAAKDWTNVAKKGSVDVMELELKKMYDTVISVQEEMNYLREREEEMQDLNTSTNVKMAWLRLHLVQDPDGLIIQRCVFPSLFLIMREPFANGRAHAKVAPGDVVLEHSGDWLCAATASIHKLSTHSDLVIAGVVTTDSRVRA
ncbi:emp24/gp25L/p24 family protein [Populus alba x Populus x berolinensis]|nr:emp24/gp25L/p24 family protein [Populus alba x Populus x berolinensis]KAJ6899844.1 emp24/gp25L/p24 family protein [Populus alba x Populus x berolinensis]